MASSIMAIPGKLVKRIQALEYVNMRELLPDNLALVERLSALLPCLAPPKTPSESEISGDKTLMSSFATYVAIMAEAHPEHAGDMLSWHTCASSLGRRTSSEAMGGFPTMLSSTATTYPAGTATILIMCPQSAR